MVQVQGVSKKISAGVRVYSEHYFFACDAEDVPYIFKRQPINGVVMVVTNDGYTTLKRLHQDKSGNWELRYEDGSSRSIELATGEWEVKGLFVRVL